MRSSYQVSAPMVVAQALVAVAIVAASLVRLGDDRVGPMAFFVVPASFVVGLLLIREQTSLAARLQRWPRLRLLAGLTVLWMIAIHRVLFG